jgi:DNA primase
MQILDELLALFFRKNINIKILTLPSGADPCDVISSQGSEAFRERLNNSLDAFEHVVHAVTNGLASAPGTHRAAMAVEQVIRHVARALPNLSNASPAARIKEQQAIKSLVGKFGIPETTLLSSLSDVRSELMQRDARRTKAPDPVRLQKKQTWEREVLELILRDPKLLPQFEAAVSVEDFSCPMCQTIYQNCLHLMHMGQLPTFEQIMDSTNDEEVKNLLVDCDELGQSRLTGDLERNVSLLLQTIAQQKQDPSLQSKIALLNQDSTSESSDLVLDDFFKEMRLKKGIH